MAYDRQRALSLVLSAVQPALDVHRRPEDAVLTLDMMVDEAMKMMNEEPGIGAAFDAAVKVVWDTATHYATQP